MIESNTSNCYKLDPRKQKQVKNFFFFFFFFGAEKTSKELIQEKKKTQYLYSIAMVEPEVIFWVKLGVFWLNTM